MLEDCRRREYLQVTQSLEQPQVRRTYDLKAFVVHVLITHHKTRREGANNRETDRFLDNNLGYSSTCHCHTIQIMLSDESVGSSTVSRLTQPHDRRYSFTFFPKRSAPLYCHIPGAFPFPRPSIASASCGPSPSDLISSRVYRCVLKENKIALVFGSLLNVCNSHRIRAYITTSQLPPALASHRNELTLLKSTSSSLMMCSRSSSCT